MSKPRRPRADDAEQKVYKHQSVAEYLAKGGAITKVPANLAGIKPESIKSSNAGGVATIITMDEADLYGGEYKPRKSKKKPMEAIDLSALPPELRKKYVDEVINGQKDSDPSESEDSD
jgi:hypothetical protein